MVTSANVEAAHVCACGHYRGHHADACRDCDCDGFRPAVVPAFRARSTGAAAVLAAVDSAPSPAPSRRHKRVEPAAVERERVEVWSGVPCRDFARAVWRMRREQRRFFATRSRAALDAARLAEKEVDGLLSAMREGFEPPPDPQGDLFMAVPALSEFLRRNPAAAREEARRHGRREERASLDAGMSSAEARERASRAEREFLSRLERIR